VEGNQHELVQGPGDGRGECRNEENGDAHSGRFLDVVRHADERTERKEADEDDVFDEHCG